MSSPIIGAVVTGALCGVVPLVYGLVRREPGLAAGGFAACLVGGLLLGVLLAVPLAALFAWLIWRHSRAALAAAGPPAAPEPAGARPEAAGPGTGNGRFEREPTREREREPTARP
jgi:hypothetical protein